MVIIKLLDPNSFGDAINNDNANKKVQLDAESDVEGVSDTYFGDQDNGSGPDHSQPRSLIANEKSSDLFNLYDLLNKPKVNKQDQGHKNNNGGSILELLDGMVKVGHSIRLSMDGYVKDMKRSKTKRIWIKELNNYHKVNFISLQETKTDSISDMDIRAVWDTLKQLQEIQSSDSRDYIQKAKIKWVVEGDENSKFFHGIINFPDSHRCRLNFTFPNRLSPDQTRDLESPVTNDEVRNADIIGPDLFDAVEWFFVHGSFTRCCNSSFVALIPKTHDPKFVTDYRPISLIGSLYKVITKILANRLSFVISDIILDVQTAFLSNLQILDGPFIINELLSWCRSKKQHAMVFKVNFAKAYDSIRWDYLDDVLRAFGFSSKWRSWIGGSLRSGMASILLNGSPTLEFQFHCGLKQGLAPYLFILIMESLHLSFSRAVDDGVFKGIKIDSSLTVSHLFYADDAVFIGEWSTENISSITHILQCFSLLSGLTINIKKSHLFGVGLSDDRVAAAASHLGGGTKSAQLDLLEKSIEGTVLSSLDDRWFWDLNREGVFQVKDVRFLLDEHFLPRDSTATRWVNYVPIKINVFAWKVFLDRHPTRLNLAKRGVHISESRCQICSLALEDSSHLFFSCSLARDVARLVCCWWNVPWSPLYSYADWLAWLSSIRFEDGRHLNSLQGSEQ
nr:RNA-directed DNA polymerase, eukaryota, reverse transcriptase zinc-binding domain protein [Tanacetum cinerariifolium]